MEYAALTATTEEMPLIKELWLHFWDKYFNNSTIYPNLNMNEHDVMFVRLVVIGLFIGLAIAGFALVFNKRVLGAFVRKLIEKEALSPERALTLEDLGYGEKLIIHSAVKKSTALRRVVKCREEQEYNAELAKKLEQYNDSKEQEKKTPKFKETFYKIDPLIDSFYIPEDMKYTAEVKFDSKGNTWGSAVLCCVLMLVLMIVALVALPTLLNYLDEIAGSIK
jgi:hypothetical protein